MEEDTFDNDLYALHKKDYTERLKAILGTTTMGWEQAEALNNALEDILFEEPWPLDERAKDMLT